jgi:CheY-like chemotaxis protein
VSEKDKNYRFKNVLLIDDDYISNFIADHLLNKFELCKTISIARNGDEALKYLHETTDFPELIFLDINMPVMDGFEFIDAFRKYNMDKNMTRIIIYTASYNHKDIELLKELGFRDFIIKPLNEEKLQNLLKLFESN